jgi:hypothetical protein
MSGDKTHSQQNDGRIVKFPRTAAAARPLSAPTPVADLGKFERGPDADDYRHRMWVNAAALVFVAALIGAGLWLADTMAAMLRDQNCVLAGHRNCAHIEFTREHR